MRNVYRNLVLDELADPSRRAILEHLRSGEKSVTELVEHTGLKQPNVSNHLAKMRERGIVAAQRAGRQQLYRLADPLVEAVLAAALASVPTPYAPVITGEELSVWAAGYFRAVTGGDEPAATRIVSDCLTRRLSLLDLYVDIFQPALVQVGVWYSQGRLTEAQEHFITAVTERLMARASHFYPSERTTGQKAVLGCVAGNYHSVGLRMVADVLAHGGWEATYLGANVPTPSFVEMVRERKPRIVFVSCAQEFSAAETQTLVQRLTEVRENGPDPRFRIGLGGGWVNQHPEFVEQCGADFTARDVRSLVELLSSA